MPRYHETTSLKASYAYF